MTIKTCSDLVKAKLEGNATLPTNVLRDLSKANAHKGKLMMRRITLLIESGEASVMELLDKLMKFKLPKTQAWAIPCASVPRFYGALLCWWYYCSEYGCSAMV